MDTSEEAIDEVLDGQQRLAAIRDFYDNIICIDGKILNLFNSIGFSNSRLAYDEIISKFCFSVETGTLKKKITSNDISIQYRQAIPFSDECIRIVAKTLEKFMECIIGWDDFKYSFNKATIFSWFVFIRRNLSLSDPELKNVIGNFEFCRAFIKGKYKKVDQRYIKVFLLCKRKIHFLR